MLTGYRMAYNSRENTACWVAGLDSTTGLEVTPVPCAPNGAFPMLEWAIPGSENGVSVTCFDYQRATNSTKPRADAVKVLVITDTSAGGSYGRWIVPDDYTLAMYVEACCAGCDPLPAVTIPAPIIFYAECTLAAPTIPGCVYQGGIYVPALTGGATTFTATAYGFLADGVTPITFAPTTSTGTTVALLAADMQTNWASELGTGTFTATGNTITFTSTNGARVGFNIVQS